MKVKLKKILICLLIIMTLNNFFISNVFDNAFYSYASDETEEKVNGLFESVVGLLTWPIRLVALAASLAVNKLMAGIAFIEDDTSVLNNNIIETSLTPFDILFNDDKTCRILNINFFNTDGIDNKESILYKFRSSVAVWYYAMRTIASAILLVILIYVGIRMALSTVSAQQKASYKKMIVDWVVSLVIIFMIQYIMLFVMYVNDAIVNAIEAAGGSTGIEVEETIDKIKTTAAEAMSIESIAATVVYCMLVFQTFALFISYFKRMLKLAFLTIISPLITLTYSIDKIGDGKAQALNTWLKEYVFTILIQPFHCIIYMCFINVAFELLKNSSKAEESIACSILAILCINFIKDAEELVRRIFSFADDKSTSLATGLGVAAIAASKAKNIGKTTRKAVNGIKTVGSGVGNAITSARVDAIAIGRVLRGTNKDASGNTQSVSELKSDIRADIADKKAQRIENQRFGVSSKDKDVQKAVEGRAEQIMKTTGMSRKEAMAQARLSVAKENRRAKTADSIIGKNRHIKSAVGKVKAIKSIANQSEVLRELGTIKDAYIAAGAGLALGSGLYGLNGKVVESTLAGVAMARGTGEFLRSDNKILQNNVNERLSSLGVADKTDAALKINDIIANGDKYEGTDELDKIMKEIDKALMQAGVNGKVKTNIKNTIQNAIQNNPSANINDLVKNTLEPYKLDQKTSPGIYNATTDLAKFTQEQGIYNSIKAAGNSGTTPDAFVAGVVKSYSGASGITLNSQSNNEFLQESMNSTQGDDDRDTKFVAPDDDKVQEFIRNRTEQDLEAFYKQCDREYEKAHKNAQNAETEELRKDFAAQMNQIRATQAKVQDASLDREVARIRDEYQRMHDRASLEVGKGAQKKLASELGRLQKQYDKYIEEANRQIGRVNADGARTEAEITTIRDNLKIERLAVESLKNTVKSSI